MGKFVLYLFIFNENKQSTNLYPVPKERKYKANNKTHTCWFPPSTVIQLSYLMNLLHNQKQIVAL